jgi:hypothetical protein
MGSTGPHFFFEATNMTMPAHDGHNCVEIAMAHLGVDTQYVRAYLTNNPGRGTAWRVACLNLPRRQFEHLDYSSWTLGQFLEKHKAGRYLVTYLQEGDFSHAIAVIDGVPSEPAADALERKLFWVWKARV